MYRIKELACISRVFIMQNYSNFNNNFMENRTLNDITLDTNEFYLNNLITFIFIKHLTHLYPYLCIDL